MLLRKIQCLLLLLFVFVSGTKSESNSFIGQLISKISSWQMWPTHNNATNSDVIASQRKKRSHISDQWLRNILSTTSEFENRLVETISNKQFRKRTDMNFVGAPNRTVNITDIDSLTDEEIYKILNDHDKDVLIKKRPSTTARPYRRWFPAEPRRRFYKRKWPFTKTATNPGLQCRYWGVFLPDYFWKQSVRFAKKTKEAPGPAIPLKAEQLVTLAKELTRRTEQRRVRLSAESFIKMASKLNSGDCLERLLCEMGKQRHIYGRTVKQMETFFKEFLEIEKNEEIRSNVAEYLRSIRLGKFVERLECSTAFPICGINGSELKRAKLIVAAPVHVPEIQERTGYITYEKPE